MEWSTEYMTAIGSAAKNDQLDPDAEKNAESDESNEERQAEWPGTPGTEQEGVNRRACPQSPVFHL